MGLSHKRNIGRSHDSVSNQRLSDQLDVDEAELIRRRVLLALQPEVRTTLSACASVLGPQVKTIVSEVFESLCIIPEFDFLLGDLQTREMMERSHRELVMTMLDGHYDESYAEARLQLGFFYARLDATVSDLIAVQSHIGWALSDYLARALADEQSARATESVAFRWRAAIDRAQTLDTTLLVDAHAHGQRIRHAREAARSAELTALRGTLVDERSKLLETKSRTDQLTGLLRLEAARERLGHWLRTHDRDTLGLLAVYIDVDNFKRYNDTLGHLAGDDALGRLGKMIRESVERFPESDCMAARLGGDEFAVIARCSSGLEPQSFAAALIERFEDDYPELGLSVGIANREVAETDGLSDLLDVSDQYMYVSKRFAGSHVAGEPMPHQVGAAQRPEGSGLGSMPAPGLSPGPAPHVAPGSRNSDASRAIRSASGGYWERYGEAV